MGIDLGGPEPPDHLDLRLDALSEEFVLSRKNWADLKLEQRALDANPTEVLRREELDPQQDPRAALLLTYGIARTQIGSDDVGVVLVHESLAPPEGIALEPNSRTARIVRRAIESIEPHEFIAIGVAPFRLNQCPGERVRAGAGGTLGARVTTREGQDGILTAGHVGVAQGTRAKDSAGNEIGDVTFCVHPAIVPLGTKTADVSVITLDRPHRVCARVTPNRLAKPKVLDQVTVLAGRGSLDSRIAWEVKAVALLGLPGVLVNCWTTDGTVTRDGDSGAPVVMKGTSDLVGHIVAATGRYASLIQKAPFQLHQCGARLER